MNFGAEIIRYKQVEEEIYVISGICFTEDLLFTWCARTNDSFELENVEDLQVLFRVGDHIFHDIDSLRTCIKVAIRKNRLKMLLGEKTSSLAQELW